MNLAARVKWLEAAHGIGDGQCSVCGPVRTGSVEARLVIHWADNEPAEPRRCPQCGEPWPRIHLKFEPDGETDD